MAVNAPTDVDLRLDSDDPESAVVVSWTDNNDSPNEDGHEVEKSTDFGSTWTAAGTTNADVTQLTVTGLRNGELYVFRVRATSSSEGDSDWTTQGGTSAGGYGTDYGEDYSAL